MTAHFIPDMLRNRDDHQVAVLVAVTIIHRFEVIYVQDPGAALWRHRLFRW